MCVGFWSLTHPEYALILCANRDESLARPTLPAHFHSFEPLSTRPPPNDARPAADRDDIKARGRGSVLSGRDVQAEGTWLGISQSTGRVALLTNITEERAAYASSRGTLVASFLADPRGHSGLACATAAAAAALTSHDAAAATSTLATSDAYAGFNLLLLEPLPGTSPNTSPTGGVPAAATPTPTLTYTARLLTNGGGGGRIRARALSAAECACGGISNGVDGEGGDAWPKVRRGRAALRSVLEQREDQGGPTGGPEIADAADSHLAERLIELLTSHSSDPPPRERAELKNMILVPPLNMSSMSGVPTAVYATRLAQVILVRRDGRVTYVERDVWTLDGAGTAVRASAADMRSFIFRLGSD